MRSVDCEVRRMKYEERNGTVEVKIIFLEHYHTNLNGYHININVVGY